MHYYIKQTFVVNKILRLLGLAFLPAILVYGSSLVLLINDGYSIMEVLRDPAQQTGESSFLGFVSNLGAFVWVSAAAIAFFGMTLGHLQDGYHHKELLFLVGLFSLILGFDDFFMIHDRYIDQDYCYLAYAICAGVLLLRHYKRIIEIDGFAYLAAGGLLALSILTDLIQGDIPFRYSYTQIGEEGFKFVGGVSWLYFSCKVAAYSKPSVLVDC